jgi:hypothetical protein
MSQGRNSTRLDAGTDPPKELLKDSKKRGFPVCSRIANLNPCVSARARGGSAAAIVLQFSRWKARPRTAVATVGCRRRGHCLWHYLHNECGSSCANGVGRRNTFSGQWRSADHRVCYRDSQRAAGLVRCGHYPFADSCAAAWVPGCTADWRFGGNRGTRDCLDRTRRVFGRRLFVRTPGNRDSAPPA